MSLSKKQPDKRIKMSDSKRNMPNPERIKTVPVGSVQETNEPDAYIIKHDPDCLNDNDSIIKSSNNRKRKGTGSNQF